jgi:hypothetical protein
MLYCKFSFFLSFFFIIKYKVQRVALILSTQNVVQSKYETESFLFFSFLNQMGKGKEAEEEV